MSGKKRYRLLMIDDDAALGGLLVEYFERFGHQLTTATTAAEGRHLLRREPPDLLILDVMLPDADGMELCRAIRSDSDIPILMLTARGDLPDRVLGLELGADDYVPKPFEPRELVARVETLMRRSGEASSRGLSAGALVLEIETRRVTLGEREIELTSTEFELLRILMDSRGRVLTREALLLKLRGIDCDVYDRSVDMLISRLRKKLADDSRSPRFIKTIWGTGYQFVGASDG
ncbi:MAG: response regulator transcription factor [bacterium]|nr:response regulator transcription factor [bacterium]